VGGSTVRHASAVTVERHAVGDSIGESDAAPILDTVVITVHADAFLRGMMRSFTGALVKVGRGRATPEWLASLVDSATERDPSVSIAPARGLHQWSVRYADLDEELAA
jgi:tRNA U38,U39,U40 pseudouridine synthase TruA